MGNYLFSFIEGPRLRGGCVKPESFGKNLYEILKFLDVSQSEFAMITGLTQACISQIISGKREPSLKTVCVILGGLPGVKFERLVV